jgi:hypothetical protein
MCSLEEDCIISYLINGITLLGRKEIQLSKGMIPSFGS